MTFRQFVRSPLWQMRPTWWWECLVAGTYLAGVAFLSTDWSDTRVAIGQVVSAAAVFVSFQHMTVAARLEEAQEKSDARTVACYRKLTMYLVRKEVLWVAAFVALKAWAALAGVPLFLLYPVWRRTYLRARTPAT